MSITLHTPSEVRHALAGRFKVLRLAKNIAQEELATRSGVSWSSLKRFEREGLIALDSLLRIALVLDCLDDFERLGAGSGQPLVGQPLDAVLVTPTLRRRASNKRAGLRVR